MENVVVLGFFDGVHLGHQSVLYSALNTGCKVTLVTLKDSPSAYFTGNKEYILSRKNSIDKLKTFNINIETEIFEEVVSMPAQEYLERIVKKYSPKYIVTGFNYTFGNKKSGDSKTLEELQNKYNYKYICVPPFIKNKKIVSSTLIKNYLKKGDINNANDFLGSNFILEGKVIKGQQIGRTIGFPTANINYPDDIVKIPYGVYCVKFGNYKGVMNYGIKPTIHNNNNSPIAEIHLINFEGDLYNKEICVEVLEKIREEKKFENKEELKGQIEKDIIKCLEL